MSRKLQISKNLELSGKLMDFLIDNPTKEQGASYIVISRNDNNLNRANLDLGKSLINKGKQVIKAIETGKKSNPWIFASF
jgi:hypothetical protein